MIHILVLGVALASSWHDVYTATWRRSRKNVCHTLCRKPKCPRGQDQGLSLVTHRCTLPTNGATPFRTEAPHHSNNIWQSYRPTFEKLTGPSALTSCHLRKRISASNTERQWTHLLTYSYCTLKLTDCHWTNCSHSSLLRAHRSEHILLDSYLGEFFLHFSETLSLTYCLHPFHCRAHRQNSFVRIRFGDTQQLHRLSYEV